MRSHATALIVIGLLSFLAGCASSRSGAPVAFTWQWESLRLGMSADEVHRRLGRPPFTSYEPTDSTDHIEYWLFKPTEFTAVPPSEAYVVWFTTDWKVKGLRAPGATPIPYDI